jgi:hypothetical protein
MRLRLICCEVLLREMCGAVARSPHRVDVEFLSKGLHDRGGAAMRAELQRLVDGSGPDTHDAVVLGYALCGNGLHGLTAPAVPLVAPRAHDCIALLMGSRARYDEYFHAHPGTYFRSTGWIERGSGLEQLTMAKTGIGMDLDALIARYGEENGRYLFGELTRYQASYSRLCYIETGLEPDSAFVDIARQEAARRGWEFDMVRGSLDIFRRLVNGEWDGEDFLVVQPGERIVARYDGRIMTAEKVAL